MLDDVLRTRYWIPFYLVGCGDVDVEVEGLVPPLVAPPLDAAEDLGDVPSEPLKQVPDNSSLAIKAFPSCLKNPTPQSCCDTAALQVIGTNEAGAAPFGQREV